MAEPAPAPPTPPQPHTAPSPPQEVFKVVEQMPRFPGCEDMQATEKEKYACANDKLIQYISNNLIYPEELMKKGKEGTVVISFVVNETGFLENIKVIRELGYGAGKAATEVVHQMNKENVRWIPGKQRGKNVKVIYNLPVKFKLEDKTK